MVDRPLKEVAGRGEGVKHRGGELGHEGEVVILVGERV